jgi:hypothetical protein
VSWTFLSVYAVFFALLTLMDHAKDGCNLPMVPEWAKRRLDGKDFGWISFEIVDPNAAQRSGTRPKPGLTTAPLKREMVADGCAAINSPVRAGGVW